MKSFETERKIGKAKDTVKSTKQKPTAWKNSLVNSTSYRVLIYKICEKLMKISIKKTNNPIENGVHV